MRVSQWRIREKRSKAKAKLLWQNHGDLVLHLPLHFTCPTGSSGHQTKTHPPHPFCFEESEDTRKFGVISFYRRMRAGMTTHHAADGRTEDRGDGRDVVWRHGSHRGLGAAGPAPHLHSDTPFYWCRFK